MTVGTAFPLFADKRGKKLFLIYASMHCGNSSGGGGGGLALLPILFSSSDLGAAERVLSTFFSHQAE